MSKLSCVLIVIMAAALIYMGAARGYQAYQRKAAQWEEERASSRAFSFQNAPVSLAAPAAEPVQEPVAFDPGQTQIFLEEAPLAAPQQVRQAQDTIVSILSDYQDDENLQAFNRELAAVTQGGATDLSSLGGNDLTKILQKNPEIASVVGKYMQNPDFAATVQQIFTNPQFVESVRRLQGPGAEVFVPVSASQNASGDGKPAGAEQ